MSGYIGAIPTPQATQSRDVYTATSNQTTFTTQGYTPNFVSVYLNGVHLARADFTATNGSDVVLASGATADDVVEIVSFGTFQSADALPLTGGTVTGTVNFPDGSISISDLDIDGGTDIGAALVDADLMVVDDGAGGTNRKATMSRLATYMGTKGLGPAYTRSATAPSSPNEGDFWYHTGMNALFIYDGTNGWITDSERKFGSGIFIGANTFSLLAVNDARIRKIRFEPESEMAIDQDEFVSHTYTDAANSMQAVSNSSRGVFTQADAATSNAYAYVTIGTNGQASNFGNASVIVREGIGCDHATRGIFANGATTDSTPLNSMEYITIASTGNGTDFGDLTVARRYSGSQAIANTTRGVFCGGYSGATEDVMDYVTIASTGNATDFGNLTSGRYGLETANSIVRGLIFAAEAGATGIDYMTIASTGNASDFGDHLSTTSMGNGWCVHNKLYAYYSRESIGTQEKHTIATAANATVFQFSNVALATAYTHAPIKGWIAASG